MTIKKILALIPLFFSLTLTNQVFSDISASETKKQVKTQKNISQNRIPSHIKKKALARRSLIRNYRKLSAKQKLRLLTSMVRTMAALELASAKRHGFAHYREPHPFWSLLIIPAYADPNGETCFLGGHLVPLRNGRCNWSAARNMHNCSLGDNSEGGIQCNSDLFPSSPCVPNLSRQQRRDKGIPFYSTTQACAYADAHNIKRHIGRGGTDLTNIQPNNYFAAGELINRPDFWSQDPNDWINQRNRILGDNLDEYASLLAEHNEGGVITHLQEVRDKCSRASGFEAKHCQAFNEDLNRLESVTSPTDPVDDTSVEPEECVDFHKLHGEHFCQVRVTTSDTTKDHLIVRLEGVINDDGFLISPPKREAVVYRLDNEKKKYCKDSHFEKKNYITTPGQPGKSNLSGHSDSSYACYRTERGNQFPSTTRFSYGNAELQIKKKKGYSNMCNITVRNQTINDQYPILLSKSDNLSNFLPGTRVRCHGIDIDDGTISDRSGFTHTNCGQLKRELTDSTNTHKCIDPDVVALHNAASFLKHHISCRRQNITIKIKKGEGEYQLLDDWLKDHQSFDDGTYRIQVQRKRTDSSSSSYLNAYYTFNSPLRNTTGVVTQFPHGRKHRTISDWLYGDGKSINDDDKGGGLNGIVSKLCHRPPRVNRTNNSGGRRSSGGRGTR